MSCRARWDSESWKSMEPPFESKKTGAVSR
jgi:hypothetical protein